MTIKPLLDQYADYTLWANKRFVERLSREADSVLDAPVPNSFPSLRATLLHVRDAENAWHMRLNGQRATWPADESRDVGTLLKFTVRLRDHVHALDDKALTTVIPYVDMRGNPYEQPTWQLVMHCFNHSTQHRGQLITMMRASLLEEIPANDLAAYQRSLHK